jgi:hypothetical protein
MLPYRFRQRFALYLHRIIKGKLVKPSQLIYQTLKPKLVQNEIETQVNSRKRSKCSTYLLTAAIDNGKNGEKTWQVGFKSPFLVFCNQILQLFSFADKAMVLLNVSRELV